MSRRIERNYNELLNSKANLSIVKAWLKSYTDQGYPLGKILQSNDIKALHTKDLEEAKGRYDNALKEYKKNNPNGKDFKGTLSDYIN